MGGGRRGSVVAAATLEPLLSTVAARHGNRSSGAEGSEETRTVSKSEAGGVHQHLVDEDDGHGRADVPEPCGTIGDELASVAHAAGILTELMRLQLRSPSAGILTPQDWSGSR